MIQHNCELGVNIKTSHKISKIPHTGDTDSLTDADISTNTINSPFFLLFFILGSFRHVKPFFVLFGVLNTFCEKKILKNHLFMFYGSQVTYQMSGVMFHMSHVLCPVGDNKNKPAAQASDADPSQ